MSDELDAVDIKPGMIIRGTWHVDVKLGSGTFGTVWKVWETVKGGRPRPRAMKVMDNAETEEWALKRLAESSYTPSFYGRFPIGIDEGIVMSLGEGDLKTFREAKPTQNFKKTTSMVFMWHLLKALQFCHKYDIIHRDVKELNVIIKYRPSKQPTPIYLIDYGQAEDITKKRKLNDEDEALGTSSYCSPYMTTGARATKGCDVRMLLYAIMLGRDFNVIEDEAGKTSLAKRKEFEHYPEMYIKQGDEWLLNIARCHLSTPTHEAPKYEEMFKFLKTGEEGFDPETSKIFFSDWNGVKCIV